MDFQENSQYTHTNTNEKTLAMKRSEQYILIHHEISVKFKKTVKIFFKFFSQHEALVVTRNLLNCNLKDLMIKTNVSGNKQEYGRQKQK